MSPDTQRMFQAKTRRQRVLMRAVTLIMSVATTTFTLPASAELYKWVDENGKVHFTDKPVNPSAEAIEIQQQQMIGQDDAVRGINDRLKRLRQSEGETQAVEDEARRQKQTQADQLSSQCARDKHRLGRLNGLVYRVNEKGERVYMTDAEILQTRAKLQKWLDENC